MIILPFDPANNQNRTSYKVDVGRALDEARPQLTKVVSIAGGDFEPRVLTPLQTVL
jgi:hypothetical protein